MAIILNSAIISKKAVKEFDEIALNEDVIKPKVGIVGEILVKYHPTANNHVEKNSL